MELKKSEAAPSTITRDVMELSEEVGNVYKTLVVLSKRANQVSTTVKEELSGKLEEFASHTDNLEEIFENREQIEISRHYEKMPKPSSFAVQELIEKEIYIREAEDTANSNL